MYYFWYTLFECIREGETCVIITLIIPRYFHKNSHHEWQASIGWFPLISFDGYIFNFNEINLHSSNRLFMCIQNRRRKYLRLIQA